MVIRPGFLATRFVFTAGIIGLLKPGRCLRPWNKSNFLDVGATVHPEKDSANNDGRETQSRGDDVLIDPSLDPRGIRGQRGARRRDLEDRQNHVGRGITADTCHGYRPSRIALGSIITLTP